MERPKHISRLAVVGASAAIAVGGAILLVDNDFSARPSQRPSVSSEQAPPAVPVEADCAEAAAAMGHSFETHCGSSQIPLDKP